MQSTLAKILVGVCGAIAFAFLNKLTISLSGLYWWSALGLAFAICFLAASTVGSYRKRTAEEREKKSVGSGNKAGRDQDIEIGEVERGSSGSGDTEVGSRNVAKRDQSIKINKA
jgi:hypothetical protein